MASDTKPSAEELAVDRDRALALTPVSRETAALLDAFVTLLMRYPGNLVARSTLEYVWSRHIADSLQLLALAPTAQRWIDLGSGGGFPGLVLACALAGREGAQKEAKVHLVESVAKKANFLREAAGHLGVPAKVHHVRIEDFVKKFREPADVVTARALAPLDKLLALAEPLLKKPTQGLFLKGQDIDAELTEASKCWTIDATLVPSKTSPDSRIVVVHGIQRRTPKK
jgi:16S rRNA (guanine527-N7)-methyltransferase